MATFQAKFKEGNTLKADFKQTENLTAELGEVIKVSTTDYNELFNKPQINGVTLIGNKTSEEIKVQGKMQDIQESEIDQIIYGG